MSEYYHGVRVEEQPTNLDTTVNGTSGLQVVIGTAPVHTRKDPEKLVHRPVIAYSYEDAVAALGYSDDWGRYTLCQSMYASKAYGVFPMVFINVFDPAKHAKEITPVTWDCSKEKSYTFESKEVIRTSIKV